jgi:hypothetical protein
MPIKKNSPEPNMQQILSGNRNEVNENSKENQRLDPVVLPVPAPRRHIAYKSFKHTYQNVPIPITPNTQEHSSQQVSCNVFL